MVLKIPLNFSCCLCSIILQLKLLPIADAFDWNLKGYICDFQLFIVVSQNVFPAVFLKHIQVITLTGLKVKYVSLDFSWALWRLAACYLWTVCESYYRAKCKFTANCTVQKIPAKTTHASENKARHAIDFVRLSMRHGITSGNLLSCRVAEPLGRIALTNRFFWLALLWPS